MIAKQSQRTADESKGIAVETRRDSTSMKTIAGLTIIYLPSTFAATIFSTGFFSYSAGPQQSLHVDGEIWKFVVVSLILTVLTIVVWICLNKYGIPFFLRWAKTSPPISTPQATAVSGVAMPDETGPQALPSNRTSTTNRRTREKIMVATDYV